jgi:predicted fused transcriptional regulator/phosphomethylpyrimidine kinase
MKCAGNDFFDQLYEKGDYEYEPPVTIIKENKMVVISLVCVVVGKIQKIL